MAKKKISHRQKKRKQKGKDLNVIPATHVPLCALGKVMKEKQLFAPIHHNVNIEQKILHYRPTDKLVFATIGFIAGAETVYGLNPILRPSCSPKFNRSRSRR